MIIHRIEQRTPEWDELRLGRFTASIVGDLMPAKSKPVDSWTDTQLRTIYEIAAERLTGRKKVAFTNAAMQWGIDNENTAREIYTYQTGNIVDQVGFIELDDWTGCSPDGLVDSDGLVEIKCPNSDTHLMYRHIPGRLYDDYQWQCQTQLWVSGRAWLDLVSFDPRFIDTDKMSFIHRAERNQDMIDRIEARVGEAILKCKEIMEA